MDLFSNGKLVIIMLQTAYVLWSKNLCYILLVTMGIF